MSVPAAVVDVCLCVLCVRCVLCWSLQKIQGFVCSPWLSGAKGSFHAGTVATPHLDTIADMHTRTRIRASTTRIRVDSRLPPPTPGYHRRHAHTNTFTPPRCTVVWTHVYPPPSFGWTWEPWAGGVSRRGNTVWLFALPVMKPTACCTCGLTAGAVTAEQSVLDRLLASCVC